MLGQLYKPKGLALETAQAVLEVQDPRACNVAVGCSNACLYCYVSKATHQPRSVCRVVRLPKKPPVELVKHQLKRYWEFHWGVEGVFLCFLTDPFLRQVRESTRDLIELLVARGARVATLSKLEIPYNHAVRQGMTIVSLDDAFAKQWEPNTTKPNDRLTALQLAKDDFDNYVWLSMEPYPPSAIHKQRIEDLLEELNFVDLIVFGKWNYDARARTEEARIEYAEKVMVLRDFCKSHNIRLHVKSETLRFIGQRR